MMLYVSLYTENTFGGASVLTVKATDADYPDIHSTIKYSIDGFYIDDATQLGDLFFEVKS